MDSNKGSENPIIEKLGQTISCAPVGIPNVKSDTEGVWAEGVHVVKRMEKCGKPQFHYYLILILNKHTFAMQTCCKWWARLWVWLWSSADARKVQSDGITMESICCHIIRYFAVIEVCSRTERAVDVAQTTRFDNFPFFSQSSRRKRATNWTSTRRTDFSAGWYDDVYRGQEQDRWGFIITTTGSDQDDLTPNSFTYWKET